MIADLEAELARLRAQLRELQKRGKGPSQAEVDALKEEIERLNKLIEQLQKQLQELVELLKAHGISEKEIMGLLAKSGLAGFILSNRRVFDRLYEDAMARIERLKVLRARVWGAEEEELLRIFQSTLASVVPSLVIGANMSILLPPEDTGSVGPATSATYTPRMQTFSPRARTPRAMQSAPLAGPHSPRAGTAPLPVVPGQSRSKSPPGPPGAGRTQPEIGFSHFD